METSLKTGFAQIFSCCPKNLSCPGPYAYGKTYVNESSIALTGKSVNQSASKSAYHSVSQKSTIKSDNESVN